MLIRICLLYADSSVGDGEEEAAAHFSNRYSTPASALQNSCRAALIQECTLDISAVDGRVGF